jgi:Protein of unknown function (DUF2637)
VPIAGKMRQESASRVADKNPGLRRRFNSGKLVSSSGWFVVVGAALSLSAYSLYFVGRHYGLPVPLAAIVSACFDGAAIACADLALKYAQTHGDSGLAPRLAVLILATTSAYLNMQHAIISHLPFAARVLYAVPPVVAVAMFEMRSRYERREALRRAGRVVKALPPIDPRAWLMFPVRTPRMVREIVGYRLDEMIATETGESLDSLSRIPVHAPAVRAWAADQGMDVAALGRIPASVIADYRAAMANNAAVSQGNVSAIRPNAVGMRELPSPDGA